MPTNPVVTDVITYQYTRHNFRARDCATCANLALTKTARENQTFFPEAVSTVIQSFYMDD